ncbi:MAG: VWA domain-containing protein [Burkholderiales bacterium]|nr:MAG: VWA domain-containing protein [Burkholderiales bacterium]
MAGRFAEALLGFARLLRAAGLPVGPDRALIAVEALALVGVGRRDDVHAALSAVLLDRHEHQPLFDAAFDAFWRAPELLDALASPFAAPAAPQPGSAPAPGPQGRLAEALASLRAAPASAADDGPAGGDRLEIDARFAASERERLHRMDFEAMSADEFRHAVRLVERLQLPVAPQPTRRHRRTTRGRLDLRAALRSLPRDPWLLAPPRRAPRISAPPLVLLCDVSASMQRYARVLLHYAHALMRRYRRVRVFTFGTRLTEISRALRQRDPDLALAAAARVVLDWRGGTRIGACLHVFNRQWARRVLTGNAALVLVTDGLERDDSGTLGREAERLARFAHQFVWLNPLLRYEGFEPRAAGIRALLPHVDRMLPVHNLDSLQALAHAFGAGGSGKKETGDRSRAVPRPGGDNRLQNTMARPRAI